MSSKRGCIAVDNPTDDARRQIQSGAFLVAVGLCLLLCSCLGIALFHRSGGATQIEVDSHINPNDAPVGSLVRLPGIGLGKASAIIHFRENPVQATGPTFKTPSDLEQVKGIGPKTVNAVEQYLRFGGE